MSALAITVDPHATQTTLSSANNPARPGDSVQLRAQVTAGGEIASGSVTFSDGANVLGTSAVDASGLAVLSTTNLGAGMHRIVASYAGDVNFMPSTSVVLMQEVTPAQTRRRASGH